MKKLFITLALACATLPALAQHYHGHGIRHSGYHRGPGIGWWVAPVVVGAIGYEIGRQQTLVVQPQPVIVQPQPSTPNQNCTPWTETQQPDGTIVKTRTCFN
jgi:hypothetical protein